MTLDIRQPEFWKQDAVDRELRRVYDICAGCRRCLPLCPSFKVMFERLDVDAVDGDVEKLPAADVKEVVDLCYQCKLCYNHCPYTPPHRWEVDFPRLMLRARSAEARAKGVTLQDRFLGNTELVGRLGSLTAPLSNWMNDFAPNRAVMQTVVGIHKDRKLPRFHRETFSKWFDQRPSRRARRRAARRPSLEGRALHHLLGGVQRSRHRQGDGRGAGEERRGRLPARPALLRHAVPRRGRRQGGQGAHRGQCARASRSGAGGARDRGAGSHLLLHAQAGVSVAGRVGGREPRGRPHPRPLRVPVGAPRAGALDTRFPRPPGRSRISCPAISAQNMGTRSADVLRLTGAEVETCRALLGGGRHLGHEEGVLRAVHEAGRAAVQAVEAARPDRVATDCPLAALQINQGTGVPPSHPIRILASAYGLVEE